MFTVQYSMLDMSYSVLFFCFQALAEKNPDLLDFYKDLTHVEASTKVLISTMCTRC